MSILLRRLALMIATSVIASPTAAHSATAIPSTHQAPIKTAKHKPAYCDLRFAANEEMLMRTPFTLIEGRIYVDVLVNGKGPVRFAVDTGASGMARADQSLVKLFDLPVKGETQTSDGVTTATVNYAHFESLELSKLKRSDFDAISRDYSSRMSKGGEFSGIIGRDFFADGLLIIDYPRRTLLFSQKHMLPEADANILSYERAFRVPVHIGDHTVQGNLDTGANVTFVLPQSLYQKLSAEPLEDAGRGGLTNGDIAISGSRLHDAVKLGAATIKSPDVKVAADYPELLVGAHALQNFTLMIDQPNKRIAICPATGT